MGFISSLYKPQRPRGFSMPTRYYDKEKEAREHRRAVILQKVKIESGEELSKGEFVSDLHRKLEQNKIKKHSRSKSENLRTLVVFVFLIYLGIYFIIHI